jgi:hypothetical protein
LCHGGRPHLPGNHRCCRAQREQAQGLRCRTRLHSLVTGDVVDDEVTHASAVHGRGLQVVEAQVLVQLRDAPAGAAAGSRGEALVEVVDDNGRSRRC